MTSKLSLLREMFREMVVKKDAELILKYYHKKFQLFTNGGVQSCQEFLEEHEKIYQTKIQYAVRYDDETLLEQGDRVAGRIFITVTRPNESAKELEVVLIAQYQAGRLYRIWELTHPDWSKMAAFEKYAIET